MQVVSADKQFEKTWEPRYSIERGNNSAVWLFFCFILKYTVCLTCKSPRINFRSCLLLAANEFLFRETLLQFVLEEMRVHAHLFTHLCFRLVDAASLMVTVPHASRISNLFLFLSRVCYLIAESAPGQLRISFRNAAAHFFFSLFLSLSLCLSNLSLSPRWIVLIARDLFLIIEGKTHRRRRRKKSKLYALDHWRRKIWPARD